jgi:hypothetical protein
MQIVFNFKEEGIFRIGAGSYGIMIKKIITEKQNW